MGIRFRPSPTDGETTGGNVDFELIHGTVVQVTLLLVQWITLRKVSVLYTVAL